MNLPGSIAVVVLAAGRSSRMGTSKPLLALGAESVIERLIGSVSRADVGDIVIVTGHDAAAIEPALEGLGVRPAYNTGYDSGMFSSVKTGVKALRDDVGAFLILPADYPLVRTAVLECLIERFRRGDSGILHPSCCGLRGHPPLLSGRYREALLRADDGDNLREFFDRHHVDESLVDVEDLTILMDMDTPAEYQRLRRFTAILDAPRSPTDGRVTSAQERPSASLSSEDALYLLALLEVPDRVVRHCQTVAVVGTALAEALKPHVPSLDVDLVRSACLLHDLARAEPEHARVGRRILCNLGLPRLGEIVGEHMVMSPEKLVEPLVTEEQLLYLADKLVVEDEVAGLEAREAHVLSKPGPQDAPATAEAREGARTRMKAAHVIQERVESILGRPLVEVLP